VRAVFRTVRDRWQKQHPSSRPALAQPANAYWAFSDDERHILMNAGAWPLSPNAQAFISRRPTWLDRRLAEVKTFLRKAGASLVAKWGAK
jgi:hypothetical protein